METQNFIERKAPCFYEICDNFNYQGIIIQKINNQIDKGTVIAEKSKLFNYSYKKSLDQCYSNSILLLNKALENLVNNQSIKKKYTSKIYKLPNNYTFLKFIFGIFINKIRRLIFLIFFYRKWKISICEYKNLHNINFKFNELKLRDNNYLFFADPFFLNQNEILLEGFNYKKGRGEILRYHLKSKQIKNI